MVIGGSAVYRLISWKTASFTTPLRDDLSNKWHPKGRDETCRALSRSTMSMERAMPGLSRLGEGRRKTTGAGVLTMRTPAPVVVVVRKYSQVS